MNASEDRLDRVEAIMREVLRAADHERASLLRERCGDDEQLAREVDDMLCAHAEVGEQFLNHSLVTSLRENRGLSGGVGVGGGGGGRGQRIGPWMVDELIGSGGMGAVYHGHRADGAFDAEVAVKFIRGAAAPGRRGDFDPNRRTLVDRFIRERQILAALDHPNIARLLDGGVTGLGGESGGWGDGQPYFVMELVHGRPLTEHCDAQQFTIEQRLQLFDEVCQAVQHAHSNLIVHRDLKPSNILVDESGRPRLLDFGIAGIVPDSESDLADVPTVTADRRFTPQYAAPEQVRGEPASVATDVYALGVILYELLAGARPYDVTTGYTPEDARTICETEPPPPSRRLAAGAHDKTVDVSAIAKSRRTDPGSLRRALRGDLDHIVLMALRKEPSRRYVTVEALRDELQRYRRGLPVSARPDSWGYRTRKFISRHRVPVVAATATGVALIAATLLSSTMFLQAQEAQVIAEQRTQTAQTINSYLSDLLMSIDPAIARGRDVSVFHEALDRTSRRIFDELTGAPTVASELHHTIGHAYYSIGDYERSALHLEQAVRLRQQGAHSELDRVESLMALGLCHMSANAFDESEAAYREALDLLDDLPDSDRMQGLLLARFGQLEGDRGAYDRAEEYLRDGLALLRRSDAGNSHLATALELLANVLVDRRRTEEAAPLLDEASAILRDEFGDLHPRIATLESELSWLARRSGDLETALHHAEQALHIRRTILDSEHPLLANILIGTAAVHEDLKDFEEAESKYIEAISILIASVGRFHNETGTAYNNLGGLYRKMGRPEQAIEMLEAAAEIYAAVRGSDGYWVSYPRGTSARCLLELQRFDDALKVADECLRIRRLHMDEESVQVHEARSVRGAALIGLGRFEEAEAELTESHRVMRRHLPEDSPAIIATVRALIDLYESWERPDHADEWRDVLSDVKLDDA